MTIAKISVVLPTLNGASTLPALLDALDAQRVDGGIELVAVDSGSTDGTIALLERHATRILKTAPDEFDHGLTRNLAIAATSGEIVVILVQDALPASDRCLAELTQPFGTDTALAGAFARQIPSPSASGVTRRNLDLWIATSTTPRRVQLTDPAEFEALSPMERLDRCAFDNVCSAIRRTAWESIPFRSSAIAEDIGWARDVLLDGRAIAYVPQAAVIHSHDRSPSYEFKRTLVLHRTLYELFGLRTIPSFGFLLRAIVRTLPDHLRSTRDAPPGAQRGPRELVRATSLALAWPLGQYLGAKAGAEAWRSKRFRGV